MWVKFLVIIYYSNIKYYFSVTFNTVSKQDDNVKTMGIENGHTDRNIGGKNLIEMKKLLDFDSLSSVSDVLKTCEKYIDGNLTVQDITEGM